MRGHRVLLCIAVGSFGLGSLARAQPQPGVGEAVPSGFEGPSGSAEPVQAADEDQAIAEARERFDRGVEYYGAGNFGAALAEFLRAYELTGHWAVLYNLGQVSQALGRLEDAAHYFDGYLAEGGENVEADRRVDVETVLAELRSGLARLTIEVDVPDAEILVDGELVGKSPLDDFLYVAPGPHTVLVRHPDHGVIRQEVMLASGVEERIALALVNPESPLPPDHVTPPPPPEEDSIASEWWFWTIIGVAVAGGAATAGVLLAEPTIQWSSGDSVLSLP